MLIWFLLQGGRIELNLVSDVESSGSSSLTGSSPQRRETEQNVVRTSSVSSVNPESFSTNSRESMLANRLEKMDIESMNSDQDGRQTASPTPLNVVKSPAKRRRKKRDLDYDFSGRASADAKMQTPRFRLKPGPKVCIKFVSVYLYSYLFLSFLLTGS